ncbi:MAG TPA: family 78 glycoside hydrolase catalytic domain [Verrucomicrobiae bacterium]|nr:family 78 glycoside hydrolase catalytic domain [Verrucomicrobiae bacterium]
MPAVKKDKISVGYRILDTPDLWTYFGQMHWFDRILGAGLKTICRFPAAIALAFVSSAWANTTVTELRCEYLENPAGIDTGQPRLAWILNSDGRNQRQTAYQILVAGSEARLNANVGDLWDSGKVDSDQSIQVRYTGKALVSDEPCFWKVRVWDKEGKASAWSRPAEWSMGLLQPSDWHAQWIGLDGEDATDYLAGTGWIWFPEGEPEKSAPPGERYFRRVIVIPSDREVRRASFVYTGDNLCRGWLNGRDLGARASYHVVKDNDITYLLQPGTNVIALTGYNRGTNAKPAGVVGLLTVEFDHGPPLIIPTDDQWKVSDQDPANWNMPSFDDSAWVSAKVLGPVGMQPWGNVRISESRRQPARWLRKQFNADKKIKRATVSFCGLGWSELYLNGRKVGDAVLSPAFAQYNRRVFYVTYDVTKQLRRGANAMGVVLGNGRYYADRSKVYTGTATFGWPKLLLQLRVEYADGSVSNIVSDASWKLTTNGPIVANNDYDGEEYDARKEFPGWSQPGFDDSSWQPARIVAAPPGVVVAQMIEPIRVTGTLKPVTLTEPEPGIYIYDLGQNMVGWARLKVSGPAGTRVRLRFAEVLKPDGTLYVANLRGALATDTYTLKGQGTEVWEPRFTSHGFRYVEVTGYPGKPGLDAIAGRIVNDDLPTNGGFECSNPLLNRIYRAVVWGVRGNYHSIPTDCPQRDERQGWLGDRSEESKGETYLFDNSALYAKWLQDIADAQRSNGSVPDIAPAFWPIDSDDVIWPSTGIIIPEMLREQYDDTETITRHYDSAKKWVDFMGGFVTNGLISRDSYGDWCVPPEDPALIHSRDPNRATDKTLLATSFFFHDLRLMERYAQMLGKTDDARQFHDQAEKMKTAFNNRFLNRVSGQYDNGSQTSCVLPLAFGLVPDDLRQRIFIHLMDKIVNESHGHIGTGLVGGQYLMRVLTDNGRPDLAYTIASQKAYPGWGYMIEQGATTIWELWNGNTADPEMNSRNHVMLVGDLVIWLYEDLAGIKPDPAAPGFKHIIMKPHPVGGLSFVKATHRSPYGLIVSDWKRDGGTFVWQIEIPVNTTAMVYVPAKSNDQVFEEGRSAAHVRDLKSLGMHSGYAVFNVGSGKYRFTSERYPASESTSR